MRPSITAKTARVGDVGEPKVKRSAHRCAAPRARSPQARARVAEPATAARPQGAEGARPPAGDGDRGDLSNAFVIRGKERIPVDLRRLIQKGDVSQNLMIRHEDMIELARNATVPVINGLDDLEHPCQIISDLFTVLEVRKKLKGLKFAYVGDGNNVCNSLVLGAPVVGAHISVGCPPSNRPDAGIVEQGKRVAATTDARVRVVSDPKEAVAGADVVYTDVWVSMGMEKEKVEREKLFRPYQVNSALMKHARDDALVMHCLPAHRGLEITDEVIDSPQSVVFDQAENRLHAQKAILLRLMSAA